MPQMRTYRGHCLLVGLAVADASDEDLQRLLPTDRTCCSQCLKWDLIKAIAYWKDLLKPMLQMRTYRGYFLLVVLAIADASDEDLQGLLTFGGLDVADASNEDLQRLFPIWRICCSQSLKRGRTLDNVMICMCTWTYYSIKIVLSLIYQCKNRKPK